MNYQALVFDKIKALYRSGQLKEIDAIMVGGSLSRSDKDIYSDIDLFLLLHAELTENSISNLIKDLSKHIGNVKLFTGPIFTPGFGNIYTAYYHDLLICQFVVNDQNSLIPNPMNKLPSIFLFDRSGFYSNFIANGADIEVDYRKIFVASANRMLLRMIGAQKELLRGNLWLCIRFLSDIRENLITLERLAKGILPKGINFHKTSKSIEKELDAQFLAKLKRTLPLYDSKAIAEALIQTLVIFELIVLAFTSNYPVDLSIEMKIADQLLIELRAQD